MLLRTLVASGLRNNKGTFIGLTLLVALMAATLTFALCMFTDLSARQTQALEEVGAGDILLLSNTAEIGDEFIANVDALEKVDRVKVTDTIIASTSYRSASGEKLGEENVLNVSYQPWSEALDFNILDVDDHGTITMIPHDEAAPPKMGEIYVPIGVQPTLGLSLGDSVIVNIGDDEHELTIAHFIEEPQLGSPFVEMTQYLISSTEFDQLSDEIENFTGASSALLLQAEAGVAYKARTLNIYMTDEARADGFTSSDLASYINDHVNTESLSTGFLSSDVLTGYAMLVVIICSAVFLVFALFMYIIALVISIHTISSAIQENFANFAILKAVGVPNATIRCSFVVQYVICACIGCIIGVVAGYLFTAPQLMTFAQLTCVLAQNSAPSVLVYIALVALMLLIVAVVFLKTKKVARIAPLSALRSGMEEVHFKSRATVSAAGRPLGLRLAWRALTSSKKSYVGLFACALFLAAFVMLTFGIGGSLNTMEDSYRAFGVWQSDISVKLPDDIDIEEVEDVIAEVSPIKQIWQEGFVMQNIDGESRSIVGLTDFTVAHGIAEGTVPVYDDEVVIGYKLAEFMDLSIGDELVLADASGKEKPYLVTGMLSAMFNAGYGILMTYDGLEDLRYADAAEADQAMGRSYQILLEESSQADHVRDLLAERFDGEVDTTSTGIFVSTEDLMVLIHDLFIAIGYGMDVIAVLLAFLAVSLIIRRMFDMERRDLGIYRALGFTSLSLRSQFALRFLIVSLLGCIVAAALICAGGSWLASQLFGTFGVTKFSIDTSIGLIGGSVIGLTLIFVLAAFWNARKIRKIPTSILITE